MRCGENDDLLSAKQSYLSDFYLGVCEFNKTTVVLIPNGAEDMEVERLYTVNELFDVLNFYKITSNIESVRRWYRRGEIKGIEPTSRNSYWIKALKVKRSKGALQKNMGFYTTLPLTQHFLKCTSTATGIGFIATCIKRCINNMPTKKP